MNNSNLTDVHQSRRCISLVIRKTRVIIEHRLTHIHYETSIWEKRSTLCFNGWRIEKRIFYLIDLIGYTYDDVN